MTDRYFPDDWPLPELNEFNRAFFTAGRLVVQRCIECGEVQHPPMDVCHRCQSLTFTYEDAGDSGTIANVTIVHHASDARLQALVPYNVVLIRPDDHPDLLVVGNVVEASNDEISIGAAVRFSPAKVTDPVTGDALAVPQWELVR